MMRKLKENNNHHDDNQSPQNLKVNEFVLIFLHDIHQKYNLLSLGYLHFYRKFSARFFDHFNKFIMIDFPAD